MRILNLQAENVKKLKAIDITPTENMVRITGVNGAGKSSILDCIVMALCGGKSIPSEPIKKGANKGKIIIDLGDHTITRSFTKESSYLKIEAKDGTVVKSPQKFLDTIVGNISFDPLEFLNNESKKQREILMKVLGINVDEIDSREKRLREERTEVGREQTRLKALHDKSEKFPDDLPTEEISVKSLSDRMKEYLDWNANLQAEISANENLKALAKKDLERVEMLQAEATALTEKIRAMTSEAVTLKKSVDEKKALYITTRDRLADVKMEDTSGIEKAMSTAEATNVQIRGKKEWKRIYDALYKTNKEYESYSQRISDIAVERSEMLSGKKMPVEGLFFDEGGLTYKGVPLDQASDGEKLMVSLGISMAINPTLRVLRIKDGSLLDPGNREIINSMIKEKDYQLWFESVGTDASVGILIEEGEIVKVDGVSQQVPDLSRKVDVTDAIEAVKSDVEEWPEVGGKPPEPTKPEVDW
jgi:hypothetical protein